MRPLIGVTGPDRGGTAAWIFTAALVYITGGRPLRIHPKRSCTAARLDALVLGGGADVGPELYEAVIMPSARPPGRKKRFGRVLLDWIFLPLAWLVRTLAAAASSSKVDPARDELEMRLLRESLERGLPILGICRGEQLLNVFFGGTLHQELSAFYTEVPEVRTVLPRKEVVFEQGSLLHDILGPRTCLVNALHRQGVHRLGAGIRVAARDRNGIIQAVEHGGYRFVIGVQWHPEFLPQSARQRRLFRELVAEASQAAYRRAQNRQRADERIN